MAAPYQAIQTCEALSQEGKACSQYLPSMLRHRAAVEVTLRQYASAERDARHALGLLLHQTRTGEFSQATGQAYLMLARCLVAEGRDADGRAMARQAADQLEKSLGSDHPDTRAALELMSNA